jgi:hypothetical protein
MKNLFCIDLDQPDLGLFIRVRPLPDAPPISINLPNPVKGHLADTPVGVVKFKHESVPFGQMKRGKGDQDYPIFDPVVISDLEVGIGKILVPLYAVEQILNRLHLPLFCRDLIRPAG